MRLQAVSLSFKVRITTRRCRGHSGMCVIEKEGVNVGSPETPCTHARRMMHDVAALFPREANTTQAASLQARKDLERDSVQ